MGVVFLRPGFSQWVLTDDVNTSWGLVRDLFQATKAESLFRQDLQVTQGMLWEMLAGSAPSNETP